MKSLAPLLIVALLTCCAARSPIAADSMQLYSPDTLEIPAGTQIQTKQGLYRAQVDERWYSADLYLKRVTESFRP